MAVLAVLFGSLLLFRAGGAIGLEALTAWTTCARLALATMFWFTAVSHFAPMRKDLVAMVPPALPRPDLIVSFTGILEFAAAAGLLWAPARRWAAVGIILLLAAMLPANISAARRGVSIGGRAATPLAVRVPMQVLFAAWAWWVR